MLEAAVVAGLTSAGADVVLLGVLPTPGVAFLTNALGADLGVMLSASHNPAPDNGLKLLGAGGRKLPDELETAVEAHLAVAWERPIGADVGRVSSGAVELKSYEEHLLASIPAGALAGLRVVVDCGHGAAFDIAPRVLAAAGATVSAIGVDPDGLNINEGCGSTDLEALASAVLAADADAGVAFDGDADRCLAVDATGAPVDGDQILAVLAFALREQGRLAQDTVVATVMSNLGFAKALEGAGITLLRTAVGDRHVLEAMEAGGYTLGGEQSGHVILGDIAGTGDGQLTALALLARVASSGRTLAELTAAMTRLPQVLINCRVTDRAVASSTAVAAAVEAAEAELGSTGRVLVRASGTEPLVRVMVEAGNAEQAQAVANRLAVVVGTL